MVHNAGAEYRDRCIGRSTSSSSFRSMSTTGKRYIDRTRDRRASRVVDATTRAVLNAVLSEGRGDAVRAYLLARGLYPRRGPDPSR